MNARHSAGRVALAGLLLGCGMVAAATNETARVTIFPVVAARAPERFGANIPDNADLNNFTSDPGMEPLVIRMRWRATGGASTYIQNTVTMGGYYNCLDNGFFNGGTVRVYRVSGDVLQWVRTDVVTHYMAYLRHAWTNQSSGVAQTLHDVAYGNNTFVAVGTSGTIITSPDGAAWTTRSSGTANHLWDVVYANSIFMVVGENGTVLTSTDGATWASQNSGTSTHLRGVDFANGRFVVVGDAGLILSSTNNGVAWVSHPSGTANSLNGIARDSIRSVFVAVGADGTVLSSTSGTNWTVRTSGVTVDLLGVVAQYGDFIAVGQNNTIITSRDGASWSTRSSGTTAGLLGVFGGYNRIVYAAGSNGTLRISYDKGATWQAETHAQSAHMYGGVMGNNVLVAVGAGGAIERATSESRVVLGSSGATVQADDYYFIDHEVINHDPATIHDRLQGSALAQGQDTWPVTGPGYAVRDASTMALTNGGRSSLKITATNTTGEVSIRQYKFGPLSSTYAQLEPGAHYAVSVWLKQDGNVTGNRVQFFMTSAYNMVTTVFVNVGTTWKEYRWVFAGPPMPPEGSSIIQLCLGFTNGIVWVDNCVVYQTNYPALAVLPLVTNAYARYRPGPTRIWSGHENRDWGSSVEGWTNPELLNQRTWTADRGMNPSTGFKLPTALPFIRAAGGTPWLIVGPYMNEQDWRDLFEYLAGPAGTPYGNKRIAQGQTNTWFSEFEKIRFECGNETWNPMFTWQLDANDHGRFAAYWINVVTGSPYWAAVSNKTEFILNGWATQTGTNGYGALAKKQCHAAQIVDVTLYNGGWEEGVQVGGNTVSEAGFQDTLVFAPRVNNIRTDANTVTRDALRAQGYPYYVGTYEGGPSYALPNPGQPYNAVSEVYGKSLAAGISTFDSYTYAACRGYGPQAFFNFARGYNWTSHSTVSRGYNPHPCWQTLEMRNRYGAGDMLVNALLAGPARDFPGISYIAAVEDVPLVQTYAFLQGTTCSVFALSRDLSNATPVILQLPFTSCTAVTEITLTGDPRTNNVYGLVISNEVRALGALGSGTFAFTLPPGSLYTYVFSGILTAAAPAAPSVVINQRPGQDDPTTVPRIYFRAVFSQPVSGFASDDVIVSGSAGATLITVQAVPGTLGMIYDVIAEGMQQDGTVMVSVGANAATNAAGVGNTASSSDDNQVTYMIPPPEDKLLAYEGFTMATSAWQYAPLLHGAGGGLNWTSTWSVQSFSTNDTQVFSYVLTNHLYYSNLFVQGNYAMGGYPYRTATRVLDVENGFPTWKVYGSSPAVIGQSGTRLWMSVLMRKMNHDDNSVGMYLVESQSAQVVGDRRIGVGFFGADSKVGSTRYWSLRIYTNTAGNSVVVRSTVPLTIGQEALLVLDMQFGVQHDTVKLYVNPLPMGGDAPTVPNAAWTTTNTVDLRILSVGYSTVTAHDMAIDEIRFGDSFKAVTPIGPSNVVAVAAPTIITNHVGTVVTFVTTSQSNGTVEIGLGTTSNGLNWSWLPLAPSNMASGYAATGSVMLTAGTYYYAARWTVDYAGVPIRYYGINQTGQQSLLKLGTAVYHLHMTNSPMYGAVWEFNTANDTAPTRGSGALYLATGLSSNWNTGMMIVEGFPTGTVDKSKHVTFMSSTVGRQAVGLAMKVRRPATGARQLDLQYTTSGINGPWQTERSGVPLDEPDMWYYIVCAPDDPALVNNPNAGFRVIGYDAGGSQLLFDEVEVFGLVPEPAGVVACALVAWVCRRIRAAAQF